MTWRLDPFFPSFLDSVEQDLANALEMRHRQRDARHGDQLIALRPEGARIASLRSAVDALLVVLERRETAILH